MLFTYQTSESISLLKTERVESFIQKHADVFKTVKSSHGFYAAEMPTMGRFENRLIRAGHFVLVNKWDDDELFHTCYVTTLS